MLALVCLGVAVPADAAQPCVTYAEYRAMPRTDKTAIEDFLNQRGIRDNSYDEFAESFGFDSGNVRLFQYRGCKRNRTYDVYYEFKRGKAWPLVGSAY